jgi:hypothetical protein
MRVSVSGGREPLASIFDVEPEQARSLVLASQVMTARHAARNGAFRAVASAAPTDGVSRRGDLTQQSRGEDLW